MRTFVQIKNRKVPVYSDEPQGTKKLKLLMAALETKATNGKRIIHRSLDTLISIEIVESEAILHTVNERDSIALSLY
jgi:hypothetical protein